MPMHLFETAQIYSYDGDLSKEWYVKYKYYDPKSDKLKIFKSQGRGFLEKGVNSYDDADTRYYYLEKLQEKINNWLLDGNGPIELPEHIRENLKKPPLLLFAINEVLRYKKSYLSKNSYSTLLYHINIFVEWLRLNNEPFQPINEFNSKAALDFLTFLSIHKNVSNRTRNNYHTDLLNTFNFFNKCGYELRKNPFDDISKVPTRSERHQLYSKSEFNRVSFFLKNNDKYMRLFIIFIICGLRPNEIVRIQLKDIDEEEGIVKVWAKNEKTGEPKYKRIHNSYLNDVKAYGLYKYPGDYYLFTIEGKPGARPTTRDYFTKRFKKIKDILGLSRWHTQYSFRHTTAIDLFKNGADLKQIMAITGHKSLDALQIYLQQHLSTQPEDVSDKLSNKI